MSKIYLLLFLLSSTTISCMDFIETVVDPQSIKNRNSLDLALLKVKGHSFIIRSTRERFFQTFIDITQSENTITLDIRKLQNKIYNQRFFHFIAGLGLGAAVATASIVAYNYYPTFVTWLRR